MIKQLSTRTDESNEAAIEFIEDILKMAKEGKILSVGICASMSEGRIYEGRAGGRDVAALLGSSVLLTDHIKDWLEE